MLELATLRYIRYKCLKKCSFECLVLPKVRQKIYRGTLSTACLIGLILTNSQTLPENFMSTLSLINSTDLSMHIVQIYKGPTYTIPTNKVPIYAIFHHSICKLMSVTSWSFSLDGS